MEEKLDKSASSQDLAANTEENSEDDEQEEEIEMKEDENLGGDEEEDEVKQVMDEEVKEEEFTVGKLVWGAARGHPSLPGKVVSPPNGSGESRSGSRKCGAGRMALHEKPSVWVRWFGGRPVIELVPIESLKSFSEGLDEQHRAQKDTRK